MDNIEKNRERKGEEDRRDKIQDILELSRTATSN